MTLREALILEDHMAMRSCWSNKAVIVIDGALFICSFSDSVRPDWTDDHGDRSIQHALDADDWTPVTFHLSMLVSHRLIGRIPA